MRNHKFVTVGGFTRACSSHCVVKAIHESIGRDLPRNVGCQSLSRSNQHSGARSSLVAETGFLPAHQWKSALRVVVPRSPDRSQNAERRCPQAPPERLCAVTGFPGLTQSPITEAAHTFNRS
jgi:hypothetical protein